MAKEIKANKKIKTILNLILTLLLCSTCYCGYKLYQIMEEYRAGKSSYDQIKNRKDEAVRSLNNLNEDDIRKAIYAEMKMVNSDFVGWIYLEDSKIDYPFVQTNNNDYYLYHLFDGRYNKSGCVFMDADNSEDFSDKNTVLYAHHMKNGTMFHDLLYYENQEYYETHKVIHIDTLTDSFELFPIAGIYTNGNTDYIKLVFSGEDDFLDYVSFFTENSTFHGEETISENDQIVLLSTCAYNVEDGRYALLGKLVRK